MKPVWRAITEIEKRAAVALSRCTFVPGSPPKRFARSLYFQATYVGGTVSGKITDRQAETLWRQCWSYRKQIADSDVLREAKRQGAHEQLRGKDRAPAGEGGGKR